MYSCAKRGNVFGSCEPVRATTFVDFPTVFTYSVGDRLFGQVPVRPAVALRCSRHGTTSHGQAVNTAPSTRFGILFETDHGAELRRTPECPTTTTFSGLMAALRFLTVCARIHFSRRCSGLSHGSHPGSLDPRNRRIRAQDGYDGRVRKLPRKVLGTRIQVIGGGILATVSVRDDDQCIRSASIQSAAQGCRPDARAAAASSSTFFPSMYPYRTRS